MKLEKVIKSDAKGKKWTAVFCMCKGQSNAVVMIKNEFILVQQDILIILLVQHKNNVNLTEQDTHLVKQLNQILLMLYRIIYFGVIAPLCKKI